MPHNTYMFISVVSPSSCAAELEVGAKEKKNIFVQKSIFYEEFVKKEKKKQIIKHAVLLWLMK